MHGAGTWGFYVASQPKFTVVQDPECVRHVLTHVRAKGQGPRTVMDSGGGGCSA